jgi:hypothetical protein
MTIIPGEADKVLQLLDERLREYATHGPDASDPAHALWSRHLQILREEGSALRLRLDMQLLAASRERIDDGTAR